MHAFRHTTGRNACIRCIELYSILIFGHINSKYDSDAQSHLAFDCKDAQSFTCLCKYYQLWCVISPAALCQMLTLPFFQD